MSSPGWGFSEFFAGGGMARLGLGPRWRCVFANEICEKKARAYRLNFGPSPELRVADVWELAAADLPADALLAWGSFPCQDLSLAGNGAGLRGARSGAFVPFWRLVDAARPPLAVLENVTGAMTANGGRDFRAILQTITASGYRAGAVVIDAAHFVPQSRPRLFIVAVRDGVGIPPDLTLEAPCDPWHPPRMGVAVAAFPGALRQRWLWWRLPAPPARTVALGDVLDAEPRDVRWHAAEETARLLAMMSEANRRKVAGAQAAGRKTVGTLYRRIRKGEDGRRTQRAEVRFDQVSGCLRTPAGGSSRQSLLVVEGASIRSRLLSAREAARLMGLPDSYRLPEKYNEAYHVAGDGLAIPAVAWLEEHLLSRLADAAGGAAW
ncbi:MAG: DNA cytosine methyltransferase [Acidobacteriia bacterium]|nr:DNA cytosine methyltransferase [Terriglobia bacterium]